MRTLIIFLCIALNTSVTSAQSLEGYDILDYLVSAEHPNGCSDEFITGLPDDSTWVNFDDGDVMTGRFGSTWIDSMGNELLLETSYHPDNYNVRLLLTTGVYSSPHVVLEADWIQIPDIPWLHIFAECSTGTFGKQRYILPLDFDLHFGLNATDEVEGIQITFLDTPGAPDLAGIYIVEDDPCQIELGEDATLCPGESLILDVSTANASYLWQDNSTNPTYIVTEPGTYWVEVTDSCGILSDTININYYSSSTVDLGDDLVLCQGESLLLDASGADGTYLWQDNTTNSSYFVTQPGTYWVVVTDSCGTTTDTVDISYISSSNIDLGKDTTFCQGQSFVLDASIINGTYLWQDGSTSSTFNVTEQGVYWVAATNSCSSVSDTITINYNPFSPVDLGNDTIICLEESIILDATTENVTYLWQDESTDPIYNVTEQGTYWVEFTDSCGSTITDTIVIAMEQCNCNLYMPNIFSPNGDNVNSEFSAISNCGLSQYNLKVFDRWGALIFESNALEDSWDGTYQGKTLETGVYVYMLNYRYNTTNNSLMTKYGDITLIR